MSSENNRVRATDLNNDNTSTTLDVNLERPVAPTKLNERLKELMADFVLHNDEQYLDVIKKTIQEERKSIEVDFRDVAKFNDELRDLLLSDPSHFISLFKAKTIEFDQQYELDYFKREKYFTLKIKNYPIQKPIRDVDVESRNKMFVTRGIISKLSEMKPYIYQFHHQCNRCNTEMYSFNNEEHCSLCDNNPRMWNDPEQNIYTSAYYIRIQELNEDLKGRMPISLDGIILGDLVKDIKAGMKVTATGIIKLAQIPASMSVHTPFKLVFAVNNIEQLYLGKFNNAHLEITPRDIAKFKEWLKDKPRHLQNLINSFAPHIFGLDLPKLAILLSIIGSGKMNIDGITIRDRIHLLLVGDPSTAKSQLLKFGEMITVGSIYASGRGVSGKGITALALKEKDGSFSIQPGALIFANNSVMWFDEADKTDEDTKGHMHESMEDGTITIIKGGQMALLQALTTVVFGANPVESRYMDNLSVMENINMPASLVSRFDLIFILKDKYDKQRDRKITDHISYIYKNRKVPNTKGEIYPIEDLIKYIYWIKEQDIDPEMSDECQNELQDYYDEMRKLSTEETLAATPRQFQGSWRLCRSLARLILDPIMLKWHADTVKSIMKHEYDTVYKDDNGNINILKAEGKTFAKLKGNQLIVELMEQLGTEYDSNRISKRKLKDLLSKPPHNLDEKRIEQMLLKAGDDGIIQQVTEGYIRLAGGK